MIRSAYFAAPVALASMLASCTPSYGPHDPIPPTAELRAIQGTTWLVRRVTCRKPSEEPLPSGHRTAAGLDLDGIESASAGSTCEELSDDHASELDPEVRGVDNNGELVVTLGEALTDGRFATALDDAVKEGRLRWALRVGGLAEEDERIALEVFVVDADERLSFDAEGFPTAGQRLRARRIASTSALVRRSFAWGRAESTELSVDGEVTLLPFADFELRAVGVSAPAEAGRLSANIGGSFSVEALIAALDRDATLTAYERANIPPAIRHAADLVPSAADPLVCERVSVGFGLDAVPVELIVE